MIEKSKRKICNRMQKKYKDARNFFENMYQCKKLQKQTI